MNTKPASTLTKGDEVVRPDGTKSYTLIEDAYPVTDKRKVAEIKDLFDGVSDGPFYMADVSWVDGGLSTRVWVGTTEVPVRG